MGASGVFALLNKHGVVRSFFKLISMNIPFPILGSHSFYLSLFTVKVVKYAFAVIGISFFFENRFANYSASWILYSDSKNSVVIPIENNVFRLEFDVFVYDFCVVVKSYFFLLQIDNTRVLGKIMYVGS